MSYNIVMNEITQITSQNKGDRLNVFLDGKFAFGVDYATAVKFGLKQGKILAQDDIAAINDEEGRVAAFNKALKYAVKKTVSKKQLIDYLVRNGFSIQSALVAADKLGAYGYANDAEYARAYVSTYANERGSRRIEAELKNAGIAQEIIDEALESVDDYGACTRCMQKYVRTHKQIDRAKLVSYLAYRGFDYDTINDCINRSEYED